jgi:hypothetical protein
MAIFLSFTTPAAAAQGSSTTVSRSDIRLIQHFDSSAHGLVRGWRLIGYFPIHISTAAAAAFSRHAPISYSRVARRP